MPEHWLMFFILSLTHGCLCSGLFSLDHFIFRQTPQHPHMYQFPINKKRWKQKFESHRNLEHTPVKPTVITGRLIGLIQAKHSFLSFW